MQRLNKYDRIRYQKDGMSAPREAVVVEASELAVRVNDQGDIVTVLPARDLVEYVGPAPTVPALRVPAALTAALALEVPQDLEGITAAVHGRVRAGREAAIAVAVLVAQARCVCFDGRPAEWLSWAQAEFGFERRHCFRLLKVGLLLTTPDIRECDMSHLLGCDLDKMEQLAAIPREQLPALLRHWDPAAASRDEVRAKVRLWDDGDGGEGDGAGESAGKPRRQRQRPDAGEGHTIADDIAALVALANDGGRLSEAASAVDPAEAFLAGFAAFDLGVAAVSGGRQIAPGKLAAIRTAYAGMAQQFQALECGAAAGG